MTTEPVVATIGLRALGIRLAVTVPNAVAPQVRSVWARCLEDPEPGARPGAPPAGIRVTFIDPTRWLDRRAGLVALTHQITRAAISARATRSLMFHAGALADPRTGAAIAFIAPGNTGKTTLAIHGGRRFGYVTDETVAVDDDGRIAPYPKPLSRRGTDPAYDGKTEVPPDELGLCPLTVDPWLAALVLLRREPERSTVDVEHLGLAGAIAAIAPETSALTRLGRPLHRLAATIERVGGVRVVRYGEAQQLDALLEEATRR